MTDFRYRLFYSMSCGYCIRVLRALEDMDVDVELVDVRQQPDDYTHMIKTTARRQVPCLFRIDEEGNEEWMFESRDIINYLGELSG